MKERKKDREERKGEDGVHSPAGMLVVWRAENLSVSSCKGSTYLFQPLKLIVLVTVDAIFFLSFPSLSSFFLHHLQK